MAHTVQNLDLAAAGKTFKPGNGSAALTTTLTAVLVGPVPAGKVWLLYSMFIPNIDGAATVDITVNHYQADGGVTPRTRELAYTINDPNDATLVLIDKAAPVMMLAGDEIRGGASAGGDAVTNFYFYEIA